MRTHNWFPKDTQRVRNYQTKPQHSWCLFNSALPRRGLLTVANTVWVQKIKVTRLPVLSENKPALYIVDLQVHVLMCLRTSPRCGPSNYNRSLCATGCKKVPPFPKVKARTIGGRGLLLKCSSAMRSFVFLLSL